MAQNLVSKLSMKSMKAQPKKNSFIDGDKELPPRALAVIYGRAAKHEIGQSNMGEFTRFRGSFEGVNLETGEVYKAGSLFLPNVVEQLVVAALDNADGAAVDFAVEIGAEYSSNAIGYAYTAKPLTQPSEADELSSLRSLAQKALPAPKSDETKTPAKSGKK